MTSLSEKIDALKRMDPYVGAYIIARAQCDTVQDAIAKAGRSSGWYYQMPQEKRDELELAANDLRIDRMLQAEMTFTDAVPDAARILVDMLTSIRGDKRLVRDVANDVLSYGGVQRAAARIDARVQVADVADILRLAYGDDDQTSDSTADTTGDIVDGQSWDVDDYNSDN